MNEIPKIIHQIWSGISEPLPEKFRILGETWKRDYPDWRYEFWDNQRINKFIKEYYPQYWYVYCKFPFNVQRWDAIRYLILEKFGGMYVDFDYESIKPMDDLLKGHSCCFAMEKEFISSYFRVFNNALMLSIPAHPFMQRIVRYVFSKTLLINNIYSSKKAAVFNTTGPYALIRLYGSLTEKEKDDIYLISAEYVSPFTGYEAEEV
ncbi:MAG: hypothetical protein LUE98_14485 [Tannerellaceae bacterium]|nr:hypothetical protein [Tannerellaceae bacterium]